MHGRVWIPVAAVIAAATVAVVPASGGADPRFTGRSVPAKYERWARASLMPTVGGRITVRLSGCPGLPRAAGCVYRERPRTIYLSATSGGRARYSCTSSGTCSTCG